MSLLCQLTSLLLEVGQALHHQCKFRLCCRGLSHSLCCFLHIHNSRQSLLNSAGDCQKSLMMGCATLAETQHRNHDNASAAAAINKSRDWLVPSLSMACLVDTVGTATRISAGDSLPTCVMSQGLKADYAYPRVTVANPLHSSPVSPQTDRFSTGSLKAARWTDPGGHTSHRLSTTSQLSALQRHWQVVVTVARHRPVGTSTNALRINKQGLVRLCGVAAGRHAIENSPSTGHNQQL